MADTITLSERDRNELRRLLAWFRNRPADASKPYVPTPLPQTPEVYVAYTPKAGIPALAPQTYHATGTGSRLGLGTGTGTGSGTSTQPGFADCTIYQVLQFGGLHPKPELQPTGLVRTVYNLSESAIPGGAWILVERDKWGTWWAVEGAAESTELVVLIRKTVGINTDGSAFIVYTGVRVQDSVAVSQAPLYVEQSGLVYPIYHEQAVDLPVTPPLDFDTGTGTAGPDPDTGTGSGSVEERGYGPGIVPPPYSVVRVRQGTGAGGPYWLISGYEPRWEVCQTAPNATPVIGANGSTYIPGYLMHYDQGSGILFAVEAIFLLDLSIV